MDGAVLRKLGATVLVGAILGLALGPSLLAPRLGDGWPALHDKLRLGAGAGLLLLGVGWVADRAGVFGKRCARCARPAERGSALCAAHHRELNQAVSLAHARQQRDGRIW